MMKIKSIFRPAAAVCAAVMAFTSCEVETTTVMFEEDHNFSQAGDTVFSMLGIISLAQDVAERNVLLGEVRGDLVSPTQYADDALINLSNFEELEDTSYNRYRDYYAIINNCNFYLSRADSAMERRGERVFLKEYAAVSAYRAWTYLWLAQIYGTVPFYTEPLLSYSDVEQVMNDMSNRKDMEGICSYFIDDLQAYVDTDFPYYGDFSYYESYTINSRYFFLPVRLLLGDLHLWRGSVTGNPSDFAQAAQYYRDYLVMNEYTMGSSDAVQYMASTMQYTDVTDGWSGRFNSLGSGLISVVPLALSNYYGQVGTLSLTMLSELLGSEYLKHLVDNTYYCYVAFTMENSEEYMSRYALVADTMYYGTRSNPQYLSYITVTGTPQYGLGDLRLYTFPTTVTYDMSIWKYSTSWPHVGTYRVNTIFLRLAEAINRAGYPHTAFSVLKYGLSRGNLVYYDANGELARLMNSGYTFYDFGDNTDNIGIHALGSGNAEMDTLRYSLPELSGREDSIRAVEDFLIDEMALETSYDGNRFFDLMRFAFRRDADFLASRVARRDNPEMTDDQLASSPLYVKLKDKSNWYLPMVEN